MVFGQILAKMTMREFSIFSYISFPIGSKITSLSSIESLERFKEPPLSGPFCDLIWSDPLLEEVLGRRMSDKDYQEVIDSYPYLHKFIPIPS